MHLVCELTSSFITPHIHALELAYCIKEYVDHPYNLSYIDNYSSGYTLFLAQELGFQTPVPRTALQRHWARLATDQHAWGTLQLANWQAGRDEVALQPEQNLQVTTQEHADIEHSIAPLLHQDGLTLEKHANGTWHIRGKDLAHLHCADLARAAGHPLRSYVPRAITKQHEHTAKKWLRITNELQMLLYQHAVNDARAANKQPALNAVWLSACGALPSPAPAFPTWTHQRVADATELAQAIQSHQPRTLTLCSTDKVLMFVRATRLQRLFKPRLTLARLHTLL